MLLSPVSEEERFKFAVAKVDLATRMNEGKLKEMLKTSEFVDVDDRSMYNCIACEKPVLNARRCVDCAMYICFSCFHDKQIPKCPDKECKGSTQPFQIQTPNER